MAASRPGQGGGGGEASRTGSVRGKQKEKNWPAHGRRLRLRPSTSLIIEAGHRGEGDLAVPVRVWVGGRQSSPRTTCVLDERDRVSPKGRGGAEEKNQFLTPLADPNTT